MMMMITVIKSRRKSWTGHVARKFYLRKIKVSTCENGVWRVKCNSLCKDLDIDRVIEVVRLRLLGYLVRMEENSPCKKATFSQPEGSRKMGRPKLRWLDSVL
jgi:hypothetical protein